ncbi:MAG: class I mannose-6-phosphate isomerase [Chloroflexi bacterium]|nr:class I mannose-6-phosphate isomerase [Chloroflexota bacterium]
MPSSFPSMLRLTPAIRNYVWGGRSLAPLAGGAADDQPIAEVWAVHEDNRVSSGIFAGRTLAELCLEFPNEILGTGQRDKRFPLLVKLLDCKQWLSLQVHPDDEQACLLEGPQFRGKTEAWHILEAQPDSQLIAGVKPNAPPEALRASIGSEAILNFVEYHQAKKNDSVFMPAGTIHALGPGLLVYEVQQTSDLTYRVFDWNRPQSSGRVLHVEKSIAAVNPQARSKIIRCNHSETDVELIDSPYFRLERLSSPQKHNTLGESPHILTVIEGRARISAPGGEISLEKFNTVLMPAACGPYRADGSFQILRASLPH